MSSSEYRSYLAIDDDKFKLVLNSTKMMLDQHTTKLAALAMSVNLIKPRKLSQFTNQDAKFPEPPHNRIESITNKILPVNGDTLEADVQFTLDDYFETPRSTPSERKLRFAHMNSSQVVSRNISEIVTRNASEIGGSPNSL